MSLIRSLPTTKRVVALTFDACQTRKPSGYDPKIVATLRATGTPATFFLGGRWIESHEAVARSLAADPLFAIGSHSYLHPHFPRLSASDQEADLTKAQAVHRKILSRAATLFRPPYGEIDSATAPLAARLGMTTVLWSVETGDPDPQVHAREIVRETLRRVRPGAIVIQHVNGRGWHSAEALPALIQALRNRGYGFVRVDDIA